MGVVFGMFHASELALLSEALRRCRVPVAVMSAGEWRECTAASSVPVSFDDLFSDRAVFRGTALALQPRTLYRLTDSFDRRFLCLLLPDDTGRVLCVGPYLSSALTPAQLLNLGEANGISPQKQRFLNEYYGSLAVLSADNPVFVLFTTFCERAFDNPAFRTVDRQSGTPHVAPLPDTDKNDLLLNAKTMEQRYAFENAMIRAVAQGQEHVETQLFGAFNNTFFEKRSTDTLRNAKNYSIIMNTLLRKAAESGGVHPVHLDRLSSSFALKIENLSSPNDHTALMGEIFRAYCRLVRDYAVQGHSAVVQNTLLLIHSDLAADLSPRALAKAQNISAGYLSTVFRRAVGQTLTAYIREKRMALAQQLLRTTNLQIQTVALHCGIVDTQYFSKIFKAATGMSPKQYRAAK